MPLILLVSSIARELLSTVLFDYRFLPVYVVVVLLIKTRYDRYMDLQRNALGEPLKSLRQMVEEIVFFGLLAGFIGSFVIVEAGVTVDAGSLQYLFIIMLVLALINVRLVCFSYAAGILALISMIFGFPAINVPDLLIIAAVLHIMESILVYISAGHDSVPVFIKHNDEITGAYITQKFWPVPVVFLTFLAQGEASNLSGAAAAGWLPLSGAGAAGAGILALGLDCIIAVIGYSDIAITREPVRKDRETAFRFFAYSAVLLLIAVLSHYSLLLRVVGAIFAVAGHEGIVMYGRDCEKTGKPLFKPVKRGLRVFNILPGSHAEAMGIQRGDIILKINGYDVQTEDGINEVLKDYPRFIWVVVLDAEGKEKTLEYRCFPGGMDRLGISCIPRETEVTYNIEHFENLVILRNLVARFRNFNKPV